MMVANEISIDTRVLKMAHDLAAAGPRVTLLGLSPSGVREVLPLGRAEVIRLPHGRARTIDQTRPRDRYARILAMIEVTRRWPRTLGRPVRGLLWLMIKTHRAARPLARKARRKWHSLAARFSAARLRMSRHTDWRSTLPIVAEYEAVFGPELDGLQPDVIHAQDVHLLGVGARAVERAAATGRAVKLIYDSHEYVQGLGTFSPHVVAGWASLEREYIDRADRIITVSPGIAAMLTRDYHLETAPVVVMNIPPVVRGGTTTVRGAAGVGENDPLVVYSGGISQVRGIHTLVEAVGRLDGVHLALVIPARYQYVLDLEEKARKGGYADRLHTVPYVEPQHVVGFLESATVGASPIVSGPINHEVTLPNKIFEYMHARLPIVISDCKAMSDFVKDLEIGEVFVSEDVGSLTTTLSYVLANLSEYHAAYDRQPDLLERYSWRTERRKLFAVYRDMLGEDAVAAEIDSEELPSLIQSSEASPTGAVEGKT